jgi:hypothetical protein
MTSDETIVKIRKLLEEFRCSNGGCVMGHPDGMHTNSGCHVDKMSQIESRRELRLFVTYLREILKGHTSEAIKDLPTYNRFAKIPTE